MAWSYYAPIFGQLATTKIKEEREEEKLNGKKYTSVNLTSGVVRLNSLKRLCECFISNDFTLFICELQSFNNILKHGDD